MPKGANLQQFRFTTRAVRLGISALVLGGTLSGCADSLPSLPKVGDLNPSKKSSPASW